MLQLDSISSNTEAVCALLLYKVSQGGDLNDSVFATRHELKFEDGRPCLSNARLFKESDLASLVDMLAGKDNDEVLLPENLLANSHRHYSWFVKGAKRRMWFDPKLKVNKNYIDLVWPNLIFTVVDNDLYVAAYCGKQRPCNNTKLYHAPLMNVYDSTNVCIGNAPKPAAQGLESVSEWEKIIFDTRFSHINNNTPLRISDTGNTAYLKHIRSVSKTGKAIASKHLIPLNSTLQEYMKWLLSK